MKEINASEFQEEVIKSDVTAAVIFTAVWCGFCDSMQRVADAVSKELPDIKIFKIDAGLERELAMKYTVSSVPTTIVFNGGTISSRKAGLLKKSELMGMLANATRKPKSRV